LGAKLTESSPIAKEVAVSPRSDAERNRERILDVARTALTSDPDASLNSIAKEAGIGAGTLYRHFPTREALVLSLYHQETAALAGQAGQVLAEHEPLDAFRVWFRRLATYLRLKRGLGEAIHAPAAQALSDTLYVPVTGAIGRLLDACVEAGEMRGGVDPGDVLQLMACLWRVPPGPEGLAQADRLMELVISGLRP
jgi:AcrR family transcriptional regulator